MTTDIGPFPDGVRDLIAILTAQDTEQYHLVYALIADLDLPAARGVIVVAASWVHEWIVTRCREQGDMTPGEAIRALALINERDQEGIE